MLKKIILSVFLLIFTACSSVYVSDKETIRRKEVIKLVIDTPDKSIYLLGNNYDYQFIGEEAKKLKTLIEFQKMKGLTRDNLKEIRKSVNINMDGKTLLSISTDFTFYKKSKTETSNKNFEKEQEEFVNDFKKKLKEKNIEYTLKENEDGWEFELPKAIYVYGKRTRLANRDDILEKSSNEVINLEFDSLEEYKLSEAEYKKKVSNEKWKSAGELVFGIIAAPFVLAWGIITLPVWFYAVSH